MRTIRSAIPLRLQRLLKPALLALLFVLPWISPVRADWTTSPMTFIRVRTGLGGLIPGVVAAGVITAATPGQFQRFLAGAFPKLVRGSEVYFLSPGGNLVAGLALGRAIRAAGLATEVGLPGQPEKGVFGTTMPVSGPDSKSLCASACTFAFLGGIARSAAPGSIYAVHRFFMSTDKPGTLTLGDPSATVRRDQVLAGDLVAYIHEMGVSSQLYKLMTEGSRTKTVNLTPDEMARLRVTTHEVISSDMLYPPNGMPILVLRDENGGLRYGRMDFYCTFRHQLIDRAYFNFARFAPLAPAITLTTMPAGGGQPLSVTVPPGSFHTRPLTGSRLPIDVYIPPGPIYEAVRNAVGILIHAAGPGVSMGSVPNFDQIGSAAVPLPASVHARLAALVRGC